jgi:hypothetical protein
MNAFATAEEIEQASRLPESSGATGGTRHEHQSNHQTLPGFRAYRPRPPTSIFDNVAQIAAERMEELAGTASLRDAGTTAGIATDKLLALSSDPFSRQTTNSTYI